MDKAQKQLTDTYFRKRNMAIKSGHNNMQRYELLYLNKDLILLHKNNQGTANGGIIVYLDESGKHGLIAAENGLGYKDWREANRICKEYRGGGFDDWRLPSKDELDLLYRAHQMGIGGFVASIYWSSSEYSAADAWWQNFRNGNQDYIAKDYSIYVRAVRSF